MRLDDFKTGVVGKFADLPEIEGGVVGDQHFDLLVAARSRCRDPFRCGNLYHFVQINKQCGRAAHNRGS